MSNGKVDNILFNTESYSKCKFNKQKKNRLFFSHDLLRLKLKEKFLTNNKGKKYVYICILINSQIRKILEYVTVLNKYIDRIQMLHS